MALGAAAPALSAASPSARPLQWQRANGNRADNWRRRPPRPRGRRHRRARRRPQEVALIDGGRLACAEPVEAAAGGAQPQREASTSVSSWPDRDSHFGVASAPLCAGLRSCALPNRAHRRPAPHLASSLAFYWPFMLQFGSKSEREASRAEPSRPLTSAGPSTEAAYANSGALTRSTRPPSPPVAAANQLIHCW